jgi:ACS family D-galactonate transporter-like MFS transporter
LWTRQLSHYPNTGARSFYLGITVLATIILYYEFYLQGAVATKIITDDKLHMSFTFFVVISIIANGIGAFSSLVAGLADRWGRANLVTYGLFITGALYLFALPHAPSKIWYTIIYAFVGFVEGIMLVATPALIRDFSPQVGRGFAMGFWTLGPVLGSLVVTEVSSNTLNSHPNWRFQFYVCGAVGLAVAVIAFIGLRELSPRLRDQLMVTMRDRALIEAKAAGLKLDDLSKGLWRQMLKLNIVGPAFAISLFLLLYYIAAGFAVVYFATVYGYSETKANSLANWYWITNALALIITGVLSDYFRVRKPFMVIGTIISLVGVALFAVAATDPTTTYYHLAVLFIIIASGGGMTYCAWMAAFTETVEKRNPAATATGLAVWGWIIRIVVTVALLVLTVVVSSTSTLVDHGPRAQALAAKYAQPLTILQGLDPATAAALQQNSNDPVALPKALGEVATVQGASASKAAAVQAAAARRPSEIATANAIDPATLTALSGGSTTSVLIAKAQSEIASGLKVTPTVALTKLLALAVPATKADLTLITPYGNALKAASTAIPAADLSFLQTTGVKVQKAKAETPNQWQHWWWICFAAQIVFLPFIFLLTGRWSSRRARRDEQEHEEMIAREMDSLGITR